MSTERDVYYAVDRFEGSHAVLVGDAGDEVAVSRADLPEGTREGTLLRVSRDASGRPDWASAAIDEAERERRRREAEALLRRLRRRDPGGDIKL